MVCMESRKLCSKVKVQRQLFQHLAGEGIAECELQDEQELLGEHDGFCPCCSDGAVCPWSIPCYPQGSVLVPWQDANPNPSPSMLMQIQIHPCPCLRDGIRRGEEEFPLPAELPRAPLVLSSSIQRGFSVLLFSLQWLNEARIIQRLVELIHSSQDEDVSGTRAGGLCCWVLQDPGDFHFPCPSDLWRSHWGWPWDVPSCAQH